MERHCINKRIDYFSVNDPFIGDLGGNELIKVAQIFSCGEAPSDSRPIEEHEIYQEKKFWKLHRFREYLEKWDQNKSEFDKKESCDENDVEMDELFKLWKTQRALTNMAVNVSGENDVDLRFRTVIRFN